MQRLYAKAVMFIAPALMFSIIVMGCGQSKPTEEVIKDGDKGGGTTKRAASKTPVEFSGKYGTLKGKVKLEGAAPNTEEASKALLAQMEKQDKKHCVDDATPAERQEYKWEIKDGGVGNVIVYLKPPKDTYFKIDMNKRTWPEKVELQQPHCAFIPHVSVLFPKYYDFDKKKFELTGQEFVVTNTSEMQHNTNIEGGANLILPKGDKKVIDPFDPTNKPITISCNAHGWMRAYVWPFDHPYAAVTAPDGTYEIKNVPIGANVSINAWHEVTNYLTGSAKGEEITLKDPETVKDFTIKAQ